MKYLNLELAQNFVVLKGYIKNSTQYIFNATNDYVYQTVNRWKFQGNFAVISEKNKAFEYLYLGKGKATPKREL